MDFSNTHFIKSAHLPSQWLPDRGAEVAFAGRSNVGKSSAINAITNRKGLANVQMLEWCGDAELDVHILLTKADKLKSGKLKATINDVTRKIGNEPGISLQPFSAVNKTGISQARGLVAKWLSETLD